MINRLTVFIFLSAVFSFFIFPVHAEQKRSAGGSQEGLPFFAEKRISLIAGPKGFLYQPYTADLLSPSFTVMHLKINDSSIRQTGDARHAFVLGRRYGLLRFQSNKSENALQLDIYGAFFGIFDPEYSTDNIGWDGLYGLILSMSTPSPFTFKLAMQHDSSHLGDEYIERTGRKRINYTREEIAGGVDCRLSEDIRIYFEAGYGHDLRNPDLQAPLRLKTGIEFEERHRFLHGKLGWYLAADADSYEENDWDRDISVHGGISLPVEKFFRTIRIGLFYKKGRSMIGEFFQHRESFWGIGMRME